MEQNFLNNKIIDNEFVDLSEKFLLQIEAKNNHNNLKKIDFDKLHVLMQTLEEYRPKSHIRQEKKCFLTYLNSFVTHSISKYSYKELLELKSEYILTVTGNKLRKKGYTTKGAWIGGLIFILPIDIILWILVGKYYYYLPIISIPYMITQLRKELKAKKENKLW